MRVGYLGARAVLVKIRIAKCSCRPPVAIAELLPGDLAALRDIALKLARA